MAGNDRTQTNGIIKNERGQSNFLVAGIHRTQTNGIIKKWEREQYFIVTANERTQTNGIIKNERENHGLIAFTKVVPFEIQNF